MALHQMPLFKLIYIHKWTGSIDGLVQLSLAKIIEHVQSLLPILVQVIDGCIGQAIPKLPDFRIEGSQPIPIRADPEHTGLVFNEGPQGGYVGGGYGCHRISRRQAVLR